MGHRAFKRVKQFTDTKIPTTTVFFDIAYSARARCMTWRDIAKPVNYVRSKDAHKQLRRGRTMYHCVQHCCTQCCT